MHDRGNRHVDYEKEAGRSKAEADQKEESADGFRKGGHQTPENRIGGHADELHGFTEFDPELGAFHELGKTMRQKGESDKDAEKEESGVAVFAEGAEDHMHWNGLPCFSSQAKTS